MALKPNVPCPCGSGKKYKKCCRKLNSSGRSPLEISRSDAKKNPWPPLKRPMPRNRRFTRKDLKRCLTPQHLAYIGGIQRDMHSKDPKIAQANLDKLAVIPMEQLLRIPFLASIKSYFLGVAGHEKELRDWEFNLLLTVDNEDYWSVAGKKLSHWIYDLKEEERGPLLDSLRKVVNRAPFPQPKLVLAHILGKLRLNKEEQIQLLSEVLLPKNWKNQSKNIHLWLKREPDTVFKWTFPILLFIRGNWVFEHPQMSILLFNKIRVLSKRMSGPRKRYMHWI